MFKKTFSENVTCLSQNTTGNYRNLPDQDKIYELINKSNLNPQQKKDCFNYINSFKFTSIDDIEIFIKKYTANYLNNEISGNNIDKILNDFNHINQITDSSIQLCPKMLTDKLLSILKTVIQTFEPIFSVKYQKEYQEYLEFFMRICLNDEKLTNLVNEYIDNSQVEKKGEILNRLKEIEQVFLQTQNLKFTLDAKSVINLDDQTKLLKDFSLVFETSLNKTFKEILFQSLCDFQVKIKDHKLKDRHPSPTEEGKVENVVKPGYLPMDKNIHAGNAQRGKSTKEGIIESDYLPMRENMYLESSPSYENLKNLENGINYNSNRFFSERNIPTDCNPQFNSERIRFK